MTDQTILNQILQNQQEHAKLLGSVVARIDGVEKKVEDNTTMTKDIQVKTYNLNSWKDGIVHLVIEEKEKAIELVDKRLKPLEAHVENHAVMSQAKTNTWLEIVKHSATSTSTLFLAWLAYKLGIVTK